MKLYEAAQDTELMGELKEYFNDHLEEVALKRIWAKEDISGVAEAKLAIDFAFESIELQFQPKKEIKEFINEAK